MGDYNISAVFDMVDNISDTIGNIANAFGGSVTDMINNSEYLSTAFENMGISAEAVGGAIGLLGDALAMGVDYLTQVDSAMTGVAARAGLWGGDLSETKNEADALFNSGLVKNFNDAAKAAEEVDKKISGLADPAAYKAFEINVQGVANAWGTSAVGIIDTVSRMQGDFTDLANDPQKALDLLNQVASQAGIPIDKVDQMVTKFGSKLSNAGVSALGMGGLIVVASQLGISQAGFGGIVTAIDTFHGKLANPPPAFTAALKAIGMGNVAKDLNGNKITMDTALSEIFTAIGNIKNPAQQTAEKVALFGPAAANIPLDKLWDFAHALGGDDGIAGSAQNAANILQNSFEVRVQAIKNNLSAGIGNWLTQTFDNVISGVPVAGQALDGFFANALKGFVLFWTIWNSFWQGVGTFIQGIVNRVTDILNGLWNGFIMDVQTIQQTWNDFWNGVQGLLQPIIDGVWKSIKTVWDNITSGINGPGGIMTVWTTLQGAFNTGAQAIKGFLKPIIDFVQSIIDKINGAIQALDSLTGLSIPTIQSPITDYGGGGGNGQGGAQFHATGGYLDRGWNVVGENGPELIYGATGQVIPNSQIGSSGGSRSSVAGSSSGGGGGGKTEIHIHTDGATVIDMATFYSMVYRKLQDEDIRRGKVAT